MSQNVYTGSQTRSVPFRGHSQTFWLQNRAVAPFSQLGVWGMTARKQCWVGLSFPNIEINESVKPTKGASTDSGPKSQAVEWDPKVIVHPILPLADPNRAVRAGVPPPPPFFHTKPTQIRFVTLWVPTDGFDVAHVLLRFCDGSMFVASGSLNILRAELCGEDPFHRGSGSLLVQLLPARKQILSLQVP